MSATLSFGGLLRAAMPGRSAKEIARAVGSSHRTVEKWLLGREPSWLTVYRLTQRSDALRAEYLRLVLAEEQAFAAMEFAGAEVARLRPAPVAGAVLGAGGAVADAGRPRDASPAGRPANRLGAKP